MEKDNLGNTSGKWIWGIFYYNKEDNRIFPPKRIPWMGWTVNFANWKSIAALIAMLAFFYFVIFMIQRNS